MTPFPGEIWLAEIPFTDGSASKIRPVLVLWLDSADVVVAAVTSVSPRSQTDVILADWQSAGLRVVSTARLSRLDKFFCAANSVRFQSMTRERLKKFGQTEFNCAFENYARRVPHALRRPGDSKSIEKTLQIKLCNFPNLNR